MSPRRKALLEAALMCSKRADGLPGIHRRIARELANRLEQLADSPLHFYPPGKPVIDQGQDSENSCDKFSGTC